MNKSSTQRTWHDDPRVAAALREREASDVALLCCPDCGLYGYYNQGSSFHCLACDSGFAVICEDEDAPPDRAYIRLLGNEDLITVADAIEAECSDAYSMHEDYAMIGPSSNRIELANHNGGFLEVQPISSDSVALGVNNKKGGLIYTTARLTKMECILLARLLNMAAEALE